MTALTKDRETKRQDGELTAHPVAASTKIFLGSMVVLNAARNAIVGVDTAGYVFAGIANGQADNSSGSAGDINVKCQKKGVYQLVASGLALTDVGAKVYLSDDQTVTTAPTNIYVGVLEQYSSATVAWVRIDDAIDKGGALSTAADGDYFTVSAFFSGAVGATSVVALSGFESPKPFTVVSAYAKAQTAPGGAYVCTIGCFGEDITITGAATTGEDKTIAAAKLADTDYSITLIDDDASGATADVNVVILCAFA